MVGLLVTTALAEAVLILLMFWVLWLVGVRIRESPYTEQNPIRNAIYYDSSPKRFEEVVKCSLPWINAPFRYSNIEENGPLLAECALSRSTGRVSVLLKYGADAQGAIRWLRRDPLLKTTRSGCYSAYNVQKREDAVRLIKHCLGTSAGDTGADSWPTSPEETSDVTYLLLPPPTTPH